MHLLGLLCTKNCLYLVRISMHVSENSALELITWRMYPCRHLPHDEHPKYVQDEEKQFRKDFVEIHHMG